MESLKEFKGNIVNQSVDSKKLVNGEVIRTVTIADLHGYTNLEKKSRRLAEAIMKLNPDIIFIAGDIFNFGKSWEGGESLDNLKKFIDVISEVAPVCITWGNHDVMGTNYDNEALRQREFHNLEKVRPYSVYPLYNDKVIINGMEIIGYVPRAELVNNAGLQTQLHGLAHDEFIDDYNNDGVKFNDEESLNVYLGHDPHLIAASENGVGLGDLSVCDFFVTGHLHDGFKCLFEPINKISRSIRGDDLKIFRLDKGLVDQPTGVKDRYGNLIKGSRRILGPSNLCRGVVYIDDYAQQHIIQLPNGRFFRNKAKRNNTQIWSAVLEEDARREILDNDYHFMLISEGVTPSFVPIEKQVTINVVDINSAPSTRSM